ncbi:interleukin-12 subunit beta [Siphateles boraxobius]|uniref:interleukin-12 subunit beta n=1 Tax=Siphateles boraxobius TaxID=180520 RepID=UPI00406289EC
MCVIKASTDPAKEHTTHRRQTHLIFFCAEFEARNRTKMGWLMRFIVLFCLSITRMSALNLFPDKFVIGEKHTSVTLICETNKDSVTWKRDTVDIVESDFEKLSGRSLTVIDLQEDQLGNYTCWSDKGLEDYTYLLLDKSKEATVFNINCTAETLSCNERIKCTWTSDEFTAFRLRNTRGDGKWLSQHVDGVFFLPHSTNSYSEESERLLITGEAVSSCCYMKTDYSFYLRDIVKPANPDISICTVNNEGSDKQIIELEVRPPSSWPQPHSFFPLKHQVEYQIRHNGELKTKEWEERSKIEVKGHIIKLRVRSRDMLLLSQWSEWTSWTNVPDGETRIRNKESGKDRKRQKEQQEIRNKKKKNHKKTGMGKKRGNFRTGHVF